MAEFTSKTVLVTGGSRGLGREMGRAFAARGANIVVASRKLESCLEEAAFLESEYGVQAVAVEFNASSWANCQTLVDAAYSRFEKIDVLINNAGLSPLYPSLVEVSEALFDKVIGVNVRGPFRLSSLVGARMCEDGGGCIINISSIEAVRPNPAALPYAVAKAGLNTLTLGMAQAFGPVVRVNGIQAGAFLTDIAQHWPAGLQKEIDGITAARRSGEPREIVGAALYLASDDASYTSGSIVRVDGGVR